MSVALFGGTFDPVHNGHLRIASELAELLSVNELRLMPCRLPPHRDEPKVSADQRRKMLELGIGANNSVLSVEDIELHRPAPSYSIDTVALIREQLGSLTPLFLCVGMDALATINTWRDWEKLLSFCHIAVSSRPGFSAPKKGPLYEWIAQHECDNLNEIKQHINSIEKAKSELSTLFDEPQGVADQTRGGDHPQELERPLSAWQQPPQGRLGQ